jgi:hypothetical protein
MLAGKDWKDFQSCFKECYATTVIPIILVVDAVILILVACGLFRAAVIGSGHAKLCNKSRISNALPVKDLLGLVPPHDCGKHGGQKPAVPVGLILCAGRHGVRNVTENLKNESFIGRL